MKPSGSGSRVYPSYFGLTLKFPYKNPGQRVSLPASLYNDGKYAPKQHRSIILQAKKGNGRSATSKATTVKRSLSQTCAGNDCFSRLIDRCAPDAETEIRAGNILLFLLVHHTANAVDDYSGQTACIEMAKSLGKRKPKGIFQEKTINWKDFI